MNISSQLAQLTEKATNLTSENDKLTLKEQHSKTQISLLEAEIEKLSRRNAYRYVRLLKFSHGQSYLSAFTQTEGD